MVQINELKDLQLTMSTVDFTTEIDDYLEMRRTFSKRILDELTQIEMELDNEIKITNLKILRTECEEKRAELRYELQRTRERAEAEQFELLKMLHDEKRRRANESRLIIEYGRSNDKIRDIKK